MDGDADIGAQIGAGAAKLLDHFARGGEVAPGGAGGEELERDAADDEDLIVLEPVVAHRRHDDRLAVEQQRRAFEQRFGRGDAA